jgi:hypothetical protein
VHTIHRYECRAASCSSRAASREARAVAMNPTRHGSACGPSRLAGRGWCAAPDHHRHHLRLSESGRSGRTKGAPRASGRSMHTQGAPRASMRSPLTRAHHSRFVICRSDIESQISCGLTPDA